MYPIKMLMPYVALTIHTYSFIKEGRMGCIHARTFLSWSGIYGRKLQTASQDFMNRRIFCHTLISSLIPMQQCPVDSQHKYKCAQWQFQEDEKTHSRSRQHSRRKHTPKLFDNVWNNHWSDAVPEAQLLEVAACLCLSSLTVCTHTAVCKELLGCVVSGSSY